MITIYTDGSCRSNPGPGGYAVIIVGGNGNKVLEIKQGYVPYATNNQMELMAIRDAIIYCIEKDISECRIYSDSQYCINGINEWMKKWSKKGWIGSNHSTIKNVELWVEVFALWNQARQSLNISIHYVKGHASNKYNNLADEKAGEIIKQHAGDNDK